MISPLQRDVPRYLGRRVSRQIVGRPRTTIDFRELVGEGNLAIVNLNAFDVGQGVAGLVGGTLLIRPRDPSRLRQQSALAERRPVRLLIDEFHALRGADDEQVVGELARYGARIVLGTHTLTRLEGLTDAPRIQPDQSRARGSISWNDLACAGQDTANRTQFARTWTTSHRRSSYMVRWE